MSKFTLTFRTDNAAFDDDEAPAEIARILRAAADLAEFGANRGVIRDSNGNTVGEWGRS